MNSSDAAFAKQRLAIQRKLLSGLESWGTAGLIKTFSRPHVDGGDSYWHVEADVTWDKDSNVINARVRQAIMDFAEELAIETAFVVDTADLQEHGDDRAGVVIILHLPRVA